MDIYIYIGQCLPQGRTSPKQARPGNLDQRSLEPEVVLELHLVESFSAIAVTLLIDIDCLTWSSLEWRAYS